jgi:hypothetical protein
MIIQLIELYRVDVHCIGGFALVVAIGCNC